MGSKRIVHICDESPVTEHGGIATMRERHAGPNDQFALPAAYRVNMGTLGMLSYEHRLGVSACLQSCFGTLLRMDGIGPLIGHPLLLWHG